LFVGGFPLDMNEMQLVQLVSPYGTVDTIKIVRDKKTGVCKGYAFLEMRDLAGAENAMNNLNGTTIQDKALTLNIVPDAPPTPKYAAPKFPRSNTGYPRNDSGQGYTKVTRPGEPVKPKRPRKQF
jgi:RNA recognition motif-containing protein